MSAALDMCAQDVAVLSAENARLTEELEHARKLLASGSVSAEVVGWLYTSPRIPQCPTYKPTTILTEESERQHLAQWTRQPVYTLSVLPTVTLAEKTEKAA